MTQETREKELSVFDYGTVLWRRKTLIAVLFLCSVLATMSVSLKLPKYYKSEVLILATAPESGGLSAALSSSPFASALGGSLEGFSSPADRILVLLKSRTIAEMVIKRFDLLRVFYAKKWDSQKGAWKEGEKPPFLQDAVQVLARRVTTFRKGREGSITITVEWKDPKLAADIANYYIVALADLMKEKAITTTVQTVDPAVPASRKSSPRIAMNMALTGFLSLIVGTLAAFFLERRSVQGRG
jgi:tyrosine-protein kinase Etk/Wzc